MITNKIYTTELRRTFLTEGLPEPVNAADTHLQIFDNYIANTRMRLRSVRVPETKQWTRILEHRFPFDENDLTTWNVSQIYLDEAEHEVFAGFEGREIRKNRYFYKVDDKDIEIDIFLGDLWGLNIANVEFEDPEELDDFKGLDFAVKEVTRDPFFVNSNLVGKVFSDVQDRLARFGAHTNQKRRQLPPKFKN